MKMFDEKLASWFRYLYWAETCYNRFEDLLRSSKSPEKIPTNSFILLSSQWYGSLYVVVEGWKQLKIQDNFISRILMEHKDLVDLLKRYRNCVYHFQPKLLDNRIVDFGKTKDNIQLWIILLHKQFVRYYSDYLANLPGTKNQKSELIKSYEDLIGWIPVNTVEDKIKELEQLVQMSEIMLKEGNASNQETKEFQLAIEKAKFLLIDTKDKYHEYLENSIRSIKVN